MSGRIYTATFSAIAVTASQDLFEVTAPSDASVEFMGLSLGQTTELADAAEEQLPYSVVRGHTTSGSGGAAVTAAPVDPGDAAFGGTVERNNTTIASTGTAVTLLANTYNVRGGLEWPPIPEGFLKVAPSGIMVVRLLVAPADSITMYGTLMFREL